MSVTALADVCLPPDTLAVVSVVVGTLWSALVMLWRSQYQDLRAQIRALEVRVDDLLALLIEHGHTREAARVLHRLDRTPPPDAETGPNPPVRG